MTRAVHRRSLSLIQATCKLIGGAVLVSGPTKAIIDGVSSMPTAVLGNFDVSYTVSGRMATLALTLQTRDVATHYTAVRCEW